jgi:hypothetical protein
MMTEQTFHITSRRPIPRVPPEAFGIKTNIDHVISVGIAPVSNIFFIVWPICCHPIWS